MKSNLNFTERMLNLELMSKLGDGTESTIGRNFKLQLPIRHDGNMGSARHTAISNKYGEGELSKANHTPIDSPLFKEKSTVNKHISKDVEVKSALRAQPKRDMVISRVHSKSKSKIVTPMRRTLHHSHSRKLSNIKQSAINSKSQSKADLENPSKEMKGNFDTSVHEDTMEVNYEESPNNEEDDSPNTRIGHKTTFDSRRESGFKNKIGKPLMLSQRGVLNRFDTLRSSSPNKYQKFASQTWKRQSDITSNFVVIKPRFEIKKAKSNSSRTFSINKHKRQQPKTQNTKTVEDLISKTQFFNRFYATMDQEESHIPKTQNKEVHFPIEAELFSMDSIREKLRNHQDFKHHSDNKSSFNDFSKHAELPGKSTPELVSYYTRKYKPAIMHNPSFDHFQEDFSNRWQELKKKTITQVLLNHAGH